MRMKWREKILNCRTFTLVNGLPYIQLMLNNLLGFDWDPCRAGHIHHPPEAVIRKERHTRMHILDKFGSGSLGVRWYRLSVLIFCFLTVALCQQSKTGVKKS